MLDPRFYEILAPVSLGELAAMTGGRLLDEGHADRWMHGVGSLQACGALDVSFCADRRHGDELSQTAAGACFVPNALGDVAPEGCAVLVTPTPHAAFAATAERLVAPRRWRPGAEAISPSARIEDGVVIGTGATVGDGAEIGARTVLAPGARVGPGVAIGRDCHIGPNAVIGFALLGDRIRIHAGAVIGEPGFGAAAGPRGVVDVPQLGRVLLQDGVTVGANSCIDRGAFEDTVIGENTKIDNLVQVAHNVVIGRNCLLAAHTGISGSTVIGDGCMLGGRVGIADHIAIGAGVRLAAASGVMKDIPAGETWGGTPARPLVRWMRETAWLARLARRRAGDDKP